MKTYPSLCIDESVNPTSLLFELQLPFLDQLARIERNISVADMLEILLNKTSQSQIQVIEDYTKMVLEQSELSASSIKSIVNSVNRLDNIDLDNIFTYKSLAEINKMCPHLNALKKKSTEAFKPFVSSTKTLCHSMGSPLKVAEDIVQYGNKDGIMNSLLKIVALLSHRFALAASHAVLFGECQYPKSSSFVFDEGNSAASYRKEIAHMARYYRLHLGSFLAIEFAIEMGMYKERYDDNNNNNKFESVIELYEAGCADYVFNFVMDIDSNKREERLVTPILMDFDDDKYNDRVLRRKVLGIHVFGDEKISLWKRWGDPYDRLMDMNGNQSSNITMEVTPFSNSLAII